MTRATIIMMLFSFSFFKMEGQSPVKLMLTVDGNDIDTVQRSEALLFEVVLTNPFARSAASWNAAAENHLKELRENLQQKKISQEDFEKEKKAIESQLRKSSAITIGSETEPWAEKIKWNITKTGEINTLSWPIKLMVNPETDKVAIMDENAYYFATYGIDPSAVSLVPPGLYQVSAVLGEQRSAPVTIRIEAGTPTTQDKGSDNYLLKLGGFYWQSGDAVKAIEYADKILAREPGSIGGLLLKADALRLQKLWPLALEIYNKALKEYYSKAGKNAEPPEYIIDMIEIVKRKM